MFIFSSLSGSTRSRLSAAYVELRSYMFTSHQEKVQLILCPFATWLFLHYSAFFCFYLFLLLFLSLILIKVEKGLQKVAKAEKAMPPYPFASFFSVLK